ncbi:MAG: topoisomerase IV, partial [Oscillospiraceae bacterium]|nr:topoisomerase IV [Oscillospiraceae bacterium]
LPGKLGFDEGESVVDMLDPGDYTKQLLLIYANGKVARVELSAYATKTNRRRLTGACSDKSALVTAFVLDGETEVALFTSEGRALIFQTALLQPKASRSTQGVAVARLKAQQSVTHGCPAAETEIRNAARYRVRTLPALGARLLDEDAGNTQLSLLE